jgi:glycerate kinase
VTAELCQAYCRLLQSTRHWKRIAQRPAASGGEGSVQNGFDAESLSDVEALVHAVA